MYHAIPCSFVEAISINSYAKLSGLLPSIMAPSLMSFNKIYDILLAAAWD